MLRDASQLTGSVTKSLGGTDAEARLDSPLHDDTDLQVFSQEIRVASTGEGPFQWLAGAFYQQADRKYGQTLPTPGYDASPLRLIDRDSADFNAPPDTPFYSRLSYDFKQFAVFGEATYRFSPQWALTAGLRYYDFSEDRTAHLRRRLRRPGLHGPAGFGELGRLLAARHPGVQSQQATCSSPRRRRAASVSAASTIRSTSACARRRISSPTAATRTGKTRRSMNYELGAKTRLADGRVTFNSAVFITTGGRAAGHRRRRQLLLAHHPATPRPRRSGAEMELFVRPDEHWDFGLSATYVDAKITKTFTDSTGTPIAGIRDGNRLPTSPQLQAAATGAYNFALGARSRVTCGSRRSTSAARTRSSRTRNPTSA